MHAVPKTGVTYGLSILAQEREEVGECSPMVGIEGRTGAGTSTMRSCCGAGMKLAVRVAQDSSGLLGFTVQRVAAL